MSCGRPATHVDDSLRLLYLMRDAIVCRHCQHQRLRKSECVKSIDYQDRAALSETWHNLVGHIPLSVSVM